MAAGWNAQSAILKPCATRLFGPEAFVGYRLIDNPGDNIAPTRTIEFGFLRGNRDGEMRDAVEEVRRTVERIDDPARFGRVSGNRAAFLHDKAPFGPRSEQLVIDRPLRCLIGLGDEIGWALA